MSAGLWLKYPDLLNPPPKPPRPRRSQPKNIRKPSSASSSSAQSSSTSATTVEEKVIYQPFVNPVNTDLAIDDAADGVNPPITPIKTPEDQPIQKPAGPADPVLADDLSNLEDRRVLQDNTQVAESIDGTVRTVKQRHSRSRELLHPDWTGHSRSPSQSSNVSDRSITSENDNSASPYQCDVLVFQDGGQPPINRVALFDTGCQVGNWVDSDVVKCLRVEPRELDERCFGKTLDNRELSGWQSTSLSFRMPNGTKTYKAEFMVMKNSPVDLLLGERFISKSNILQLISGGTPKNIGVLKKTLKSTDKKRLEKHESDRLRLIREEEIRVNEAEKAEQKRKGKDKADDVVS